MCSTYEPTQNSDSFHPKGNSITFQRIKLTKKDHNYYRKLDYFDREYSCRKIQLTINIGDIGTSRNLFLIFLDFELH